MIGTTISHYRILKKLGEGGMSVVYQAEDLKLGRLVALKFLPPSLAAGEAEKQRFMLEARTASSLDHPNICTIYEIDETRDGQIYMAMACYEGETLKNRLEKGRLSIPEALQIALQIAQGLAKAHARAIIHCDVKPANIIFTTDSIAKILDFGIARLLAPGQRDGSASTAGTVAYMAPEQTRGEPVDQRADIWSLGVLLYEMIAGRLPFDGDLEIELLYAINNEAPIPIQNLRPEVPDALATLLNQSLARNPSARYQTIVELIAALGRCLRTGADAGTTNTSGEEPQASPAKRKRRRVLQLTAALLLLAVPLLFWLLWPRHMGESPPPLSDKTFAIFPFTVNGAADMKYLEEGMMDLFYTNLNGAGGLRTVDPRALLNQLRLLRKEKIDFADAQNIARFFGARHFIMGSLIAANGELRCSAALHDAAGDGREAIPVTAEGKGDDLFALVDGLTRQILARYSTAPADRVELLGARTTQSLPALKAYLQGIREDRDGHLQEARRFYSQAVDLDSAFAMAWLNLGYLEWGYLMELDRAQRCLEQASRHRGMLSSRDQSGIDFLQAVLQGEHERALEIAGQIVHEFPDDVWGWTQVASLWPQWANQLGRSVLERYDAFAKLLQLDPENASNYQQVLFSAYIRGDLAEIDHYIARFRQLSPDHEYGWMVLAPRAFITGDPADQRTILQEARLVDDGNLLNGIANSSVLAKNLTDVIPLTRVAVEAERSPAIRASGCLFLGLQEMSRGRWGAAMAKLDTLEQLHPGYKFIIQGLYNPLFFEMAPADRPPGQPGSFLPTGSGGELEKRFITEMAFADARNLLRQIELYSLGLAASYSGDSLKAGAAAATLLAGTPPEEARSLVRIWAATLRALIARSGRRYEAALTQLEKERVVIRFPLFWSPVYNTAFSRYLRATLLEELGRDDEALAWFASIAQNYHYDLPFRAPAALHRARIHDRNGRKTAAIREYERFLALWRKCDPEFKPLVAEAEARITALR